MKKLIIVIVLCLCTNSFAEPLVWYTSKTEAIAAAMSEGKKIILIAGRDTSSQTTFMRNTVFESTSPPIGCLLKQQFVLWYSDIDENTDYETYTSGLSSWYLPLICSIDPNSSDHYLDRTTGSQSAADFYSRIKTISGSDCVMPLILGSVKDSDGNGIADVMINFSDNNGMATTDASGNFTHPVLPGWTGTLTPYKVGYTFNPQKHYLNVVTSDQSGKDCVGTVDGNPYIFEMHHAGRVVELVMPQPEYNAWNGDVASGAVEDWKKISNFLYKYFVDDFDYIFLISNNETVPTGMDAVGRYRDVRSNVACIGRSLYDYSSLYGSSGRLYGIIHLSFKTGLSQGPSLHELMHSWANSMIPTSNSPHWGFSSAGGQLGGFKRETLVDLGGGIYQANNGKLNSTSFGEYANGGNSLPYSDIELYLMGLIDKSEVSPLKVAIDPHWIDDDTGKFSAAGFQEFTIDNIIETHGARIPSSSDSQKAFRAIAVVLTPRPLSDLEWDEVDQNVMNFSLAADDGDSRNFNFWEATRGLASMSMNNLKGSLIVRNWCDTPALTIGAPSATLTKIGPVTFTVTCTGGDVATPSIANVTLNGTGTANGTISVGGTGNADRTVTISNITGDGTIGISIATGPWGEHGGNHSSVPSATFAVDNTSPVVSAGTNVTSNVPFTQTGTATDANTTTYSWGKVTGPGTITFGSPGGASTTIVADNDGTYIIRLTATDAVGNSAHSDMTLMWDTLSPTGDPVWLYPRTGQMKCFDTSGAEIDCTGTGQDGETRSGVAWPSPKFMDHGDGTISDRLTGLMWLKDANCLKTKCPSHDNDGTVGDGSVNWQNALDFVAQINNGTFSDCGGGYTDWRLPNINEIESLIDYGEENYATWFTGQGFTNIRGSYWSSTTVASSKDNAWIIWMYGPKGWSGGYDKITDTRYVWPVRSDQSGIVQPLKTGQTACYNSTGAAINCTGTGQDGDTQTGAAWPSPRFSPGKVAEADCMLDNLTGLMWAKNGNLPSGPKTWQDGLSYIAALNAGTGLCGYQDWRLSNIIEMESLFNGDVANTAAWLNSQGFTNMQGNYYWSSTTAPSSNYKNSAWYAYMYATSKDYYNKTNNLYILPVRGGQMGTGISINSGTTLTDNPDVKLKLIATDVNGVVQMKFSNDGTIWTEPEAYVREKFFTLPSGDGEKTLYVQFADSVGNWSQAYHYTITLDTTAPLVTIGQPSASLTRNGSITYTVVYTGADAVTLLNATVALNKTGTANGTVTVSGSDNTTRTVTISGITGDGTLGISIGTGTASDSAGNLALAAGPSAIFTVDNTAPTVSAGGNQTKNAVFTQTGTVPDTDTVAYHWSRQSGPGTVTFGTVNGLSTTISASADGTYTIRFTATDAAGNISFSDMTLLWDTAAPTVAIGSPSASIAKSGPITYTVTYANADAVTLTNANITLNKMGTANGAIVVSGTGNTTRTVTISGITGDGTLGISIASGTASDTAGNLAAAAGPGTTFTVDNTAPVTTISGKPEAITNATTASFTFNASETSTFQCQLDGGGFIACTGPKDYMGLAPISHTFTVKAIDMAGNTEALPPSYTWIVDTTKPVVGVNFAGGLYTNTGTVTLTLSGTDASGLAGIMFSWNGGTTWGAEETYGTTKTWNLGSSDGLKTVYVKFKDHAGNWSDPFRFDLTLDTTAPVLNVTSPATCTNNPALTVSGTVSDATSGVNSLTINGQTATIQTNGSFSQAVTLTSGVNTLTIIATDNAGNTKEATETISLDQTAPVLTVSAPEEKGDVDLKTGVAMIDVKGTVNENATVILQVNNGSVHALTVANNSFSSPVTLTYGLNTIEVTATDRAGNLMTVNRIIYYCHMGDIDGNGSLTMADAILAMQVLSGVQPPVATYWQADVNGDNRIGMEEVIYIMQTLSGMR